MAQFTTFATTTDDIFATDKTQIAGWNDLYLDGSGNIAIVEDIYALSNITLNAVRTSVGELQYNLSKGVPYFTTIFAGKEFIPVWKKAMTDTVESVDGVDSVQDFQITITGNTLTYSMTIKTIAGVVTING